MCTRDTSDLTSGQIAIKRQAHRFAKEVLRSHHGGGVAGIGAASNCVTTLAR